MHVFPSIEWLADQSDAIGVYTVTAVHIDQMPEAANPSKKQWGRWGIATLELDLADAKKGRPPVKLKSTYLLTPTDSTEDIQREIDTGHQVLCFLRDTENRYFINLDSPAEFGQHTPYSANFDVLHSRYQILSLLDKRLNRLAAVLTADEREHMVKIPAGTPAYRGLYARSSYFLIIPDDIIAKAGLVPYRRPISDNQNWQ